MYFIKNKWQYHHYDMPCKTKYLAAQYNVTENIVGGLFYIQKCHDYSAKPAVKNCASSDDIISIY